MEQVEFDLIVPLVCGHGDGRREGHFIVDGTLIHMGRDG